GDRLRWDNRIGSWGDRPGKDANLRLDPAGYRNSNHCRLRFARALPRPAVFSQPARWRRRRVPPTGPPYSVNRQDSAADPQHRSRLAKRPVTAWRGRLRGGLAWGCSRGNERRGQMKGTDLKPN